MTIRCQKGWKQIAAHAFETITKFDRLKNWLPESSRCTSSPVWKIKILNQDFSFIPLPSEPAWLKIHYLSSFFTLVAYSNNSKLPGSCFIFFCLGYQFSNYYFVFSVYFCKFFSNIYLYLDFLTNLVLFLCELLVLDILITGLKWCTTL